MKAFFAKYKQSVSGWPVPKLGQRRGIRAYPLSLLGVITAFVGVGSILLTMSRAANPAISIEPENGTVTSGASLNVDGTASGGKSIKFGADSRPYTPLSLQAIPGGNSIALIWIPSEGPKPATSYKVFRNGTHIGTATPRADSRVFKKGSRFHDMKVTPGTQYTYQVQAVSADGQVSGMSASAIVTPSANTTPVPTITLDASAAPDLANWINTVAIPEIKVWYPKVSDRSAYPTYWPASKIHIVLENNPDTVAYAIASQGKIGVGIQYLKKYPDDVGAFIHEATHIIHAGKNGPGWVTEGFADWAREYVYQDRPPILHTGQTYQNGYTQGSMFLEWMRRTYNANLIKDVVVATHNGTYTDNFFPSKTGGLNPDQLWAKMTHATIKSTSLTNICADNSGGIAANGNPIISYGCISGNTTSQRWAWMAQPNNYVSFQVQGLCMQVDHSSNGLYGSAVEAGSCNGQPAQLWRANTDGTIAHPYSGRCLTGSSVPRTQFTVLKCSSTDPNQKWKFQ